MVEALGLDKVPSGEKEDEKEYYLDKIGERAESRQNGDEVEVVDGYSESELLQHGVEKQRYSRENAFEYKDLEFADTVIPIFLGAGAFGVVEILGGNGYLVGTATFGVSKLASRSVLQYSGAPAKDEELEEAFQQYTNDL
jgi:hypothetical protein